MSQSNSGFVISSDGIQMPDSAAVLAQVQAYWLAALGDALNVNPATPQGQLMASAAAAIQDKNSQLLTLAQNFNPRTADGQFQDALAQIYFLTRQPARSTVVQVLCTGLAGTVIPGTDTSTSPAQVQTVDGDLLTCQQTGTIGTDGTVTLQFAANETGPIVIGAEAVDSIVQAIPGWDTASNPTAGVTGQDVESRAAFEARRYASVALNARSVAAAVYAEVGQLSGVIDLVVRQNRGDTAIEIDGVTLAPHSIFVSVVGGENDDIAQAIYGSLSAGCDYNGNTSVVVTDPVTGAQETVTFTRPTDLPISVQVTIRQNSTTPGNIAELIQAAVVANFNGESATAGSCGLNSTRVSMGSDLYASRFYAPIILAGVTELVSVQLAAGEAPLTWADYVHIPIDQAPTIDTDAVTVIVQESQA